MHIKNLYLTSYSQLPVEALEEVAVGVKVVVKVGIEVERMVVIDELTANKNNRRSKFHNRLFHNK